MNFTTTNIMKKKRRHRATRQIACNAKKTLKRRNPESNNFVFNVIKIQVLVD